VKYSNAQTVFGKFRAAFTLIELLTVIGIIAILMALAVPAWAGFQTKSKSTASFQNLRQWAQALLTYAADNAGAIPYEGSRDNFSWNQLGTVSRGDDRAWFNLLPPYVNQKPMMELATTKERQFHTAGTGIHRCPLVRFRTEARPSFSYMMNSQLYASDGPSNSADNPLRMPQIPFPSRTVIFADANVGNNPAAAENDRARGRGRHVGDRQPRQHTNLVMLDGSVQNFSAEYLRPDTFTGPDGVAYTENNRPDVIWNPWIAPVAR
jgi:prepilin-type N-terminal cleavage/methylation domain-containing protein